jgi:hypothetical protein
MLIYTLGESNTWDNSHQIVFWNLIKTLKINQIFNFIMRWWTFTWCSCFSCYLMLLILHFLIFFVSSWKKHDSFKETWFLIYSSSWQNASLIQREWDSFFPTSILARYSLFDSFYLIFIFDVLEILGSAILNKWNFENFWWN